MGRWGNILKRCEVNRRAGALILTGLLLGLCALAVSGSLHAALHADTALATHHCAVVAFAQAQLIGFVSGAAVVHCAGCFRGTPGGPRLLAAMSLDLRQPPSCGPPL